MKAMLFNLVSACPPCFYPGGVIYIPTHTVMWEKPWDEGNLTTAHRGSSKAAMPPAAKKPSSQNLADVFPV